MTQKMKKTEGHDQLSKLHVPSSKALQDKLEDAIKKAKKPKERVFVLCAICEEQSCGGSYWEDSE